LFATTAMGASLQVRVVTNAAAPDGQGGTAPVSASVPVFVQARLDGGGAPTSSGLALIGLNVDVTPGGGAADADLCDTGGFLLLSPVAMEAFDRVDYPGTWHNKGLTNPSASANLSGYSGTCDGAGALRQVGGGANSIGNTPGGAPYPIGDSSGSAGVQIPTGIGNGGWTTIAEGDIDASSLTGAQTWTISANTAFANTINNGQTQAPYAVSEATPVTIVGSLLISAGVNCHNADVNCDGSVTALDIGVIVNPSNWLKPQGAAACDRSNVDSVNGTIATDIAVLVLPANWLQVKTPGGAAGCTCTTATAAGCIATGVPAGNIP
jgi:hypothetical protein